MSIGSVVSSLLKEARNRAALSQRDLAGFARTAQSVVGRIESGQASPSVATLIHLLGAAGFDLKMEIVPQRVADPVVEAYKPGIDRTLLIENLRHSVDERLRINTQILLFGNELRRAMKVAEKKP